MARAQHCHASFLDSMRNSQALAQVMMRPTPFMCIAISGISFQISCRLNTVLAMDPERIRTTLSCVDQHQEQQQAAEDEYVWCQSLLSVRQELLQWQQHQLACLMQQKQYQQVQQERQCQENEGDHHHQQPEQSLPQQQHREDYHCYGQQQQQEQCISPDMQNLEQQQESLGRDEAALLQSIEQQLTEMQEEFSRANTKVGLGQVHLCSRRYFLRDCFQHKLSY